MTNYIKHYKKFYEHKIEKIINNREDYDITETNDNISLKVSDTNSLVITKPLYDILPNKIEYYKNKISDIYNKINSIQKLYLTSNKDIYENKIIKLFQKLNDYKKSLKQNQELYEELNKNNINSNINNGKEILDKIMEETDDIKIKKLFSKYHSMKKDETVMEEDYIKYFNKISEPESKNAFNPKLKKILKVQAKKPPKTDNEIKKEIKKALFKTLTECKSKKKSEETYMSKSEIIELIQNRKELLEKMPKNYKSLSKDELCDHYFS